MGRAEKNGKNPPFCAEVETVGELPSELQHLQNLIDGAKNEPNHCADILRDMIRSAADKAPTEHVIRIAQTIFECGVDVEIGKRAGLN